MITFDVERSPLSVSGLQKAEHGELIYQCIGRMLWLSITPVWVSTSHDFGREAPQSPCFELKEHDHEKHVDPIT